MEPFDRKVRAGVYALMVTGVRPVDPNALVDYGGWDRAELVDGLSRLDDEHRIVLDHTGVVAMAHPFSGGETPYRAVIGQRHWYANCAWDALAILSLLGDGRVQGPNHVIWEVEGGSVEPNGVIHLLVPAREFWDDIGFT